MIATENVSRYLNRLASKAPTPGGGAAGALHVAQAAALVSMVAHFTTGKAYQSVEVSAQTMAKACEHIISQALLAADEDERLFGQLITVYQLPKDTDAHKQTRSRNIQTATVAATEPLMKTVSLAKEVIAYADELLVFGNKNVISDVAAAAEAARAALSTALVTLQMNVAAIDDDKVRQKLQASVLQAQISIAKADEVSQQVREQIKGAHQTQSHQAQRLSGKPVAEAIRHTIQQNLHTLKTQQVVPTLAVILATDNEATIWYVNSIQRAAQAQGLVCQVYELSRPTQQDLAQLIQSLNQDEQTHGIILQTPLYEGLNATELVNLIDVNKDIDGANALSLGRLSMGQEAFAPATARAVVEILDHYQVDVAGENVAIIGRSAVVGKPLAQLLLHKNATVTLCHSRSKHVSEHTKNAKVIAVAVGKIDLLQAQDVSDNSIVIDVGTNVDEAGHLVGDVAANVAQVAKALSPVPGGVGTVTTALLLLHTTEAALKCHVARSLVAPM